VIRDSPYLGRSGPDYIGAVRYRSILGLFALSCAYAGVARAGNDPVSTPPGEGQPVVAIAVAGRDLAYRACAGAPCAPGSGDPAIQLPPGVSTGSVELSSLSLGAGRHVAWAHAPGFDALVGVVPGTNEPRVLWSGVTGLAEGESGERHGNIVKVTDPAADGTVRILLGELREDVTICGRESILSPKLLDPKDLAWKGAAVQRLTQRERDSAVAITAAGGATPAQAPSVKLLRAVSASSAIGSPWALTDGDPETTWAEQRGGDGRGEFVQLNAPEQVEIRSLSFVVRPPTREAPKAVAPRKIWIATPDALFAVTFPEDGWARPGASYDVGFAAPIKTPCLALVLDEAYAPAHKRDVDVTLAEVTAHTEFDDKPDLDALVGALAGGQSRARMAAAILSRGADPAYDAVAKAYPTLDDAGRTLALEVMDNAPCSKSAPVYVTAIGRGRSGEVLHAVDRLRRCGRGAAPALVQALSSGPDTRRIVAANELALVAPDRAIGSILPLLPGATSKTRSELRAALHRAAQSPAARDAISAALSDAALAPVASIDLMRSLPIRADLRAPAAAALSRLAPAGADFRSRYLLLEPGARLAKIGDPGAEAFLFRSFADSDAHVRAHAAEVAGDVPSAAAKLVGALSDADPRVRDAAVVSLGRVGDPEARPANLVDAIAARLRSDQWTFVRGHAADALATSPKSASADQALAEALMQEPSARVRARAVEALGLRGARGFVEAIRGRLNDDEEDLDVRVRAARAIGRLCDRREADNLTSLARKGSSSSATPRAQAISAAATAALGRLSPGDLKQRLAPLLSPSAPRMLNEAAKGALASDDRCQR
jgi:HEAT repeat protein